VARLSRREGSVVGEAREGGELVELAAIGGTDIIFYM
jgi:hypothetical protein